MKKVFFVTALSMFICLTSYTQFELDKMAFKLIDYQRYTDCSNYLKDKISKNPKDGQSYFWLVQDLLEQDEVFSITKTGTKNAREVLENAQAALGTSDPWIQLGFANLGVIEGGDFNVAKQRYEDIFNTTTPIKGKNKGKPIPSLVVGLARFYNHISRNIGDRQYVVDKVKLALEFTPIEPALYQVIGYNYVKLNTEFGGEAILAFKQLQNLEKNNPMPYYLQAKIYATHNTNDDIVDNLTSECIKIDPNFAPIYYLIFDYYDEKNADKAKHALDTYLQLAEPSPRIEFVSAEYAYRTKNFKASLEQCEALEDKYGIDKVSQLSLLLALNYSKIQDYTNAVKYLDIYFSKNPEDVNESLLESAIDIYSQVPGLEDKTANLIEQSIDIQKSLKNKISLAKKGYELMNKAKLYNKAYQWYIKIITLKNNQSDETDIYNLVDLSYKSKLVKEAIYWSKQYISSHPESANGYVLYRRSIFALDPDTSTNVASAYFDTLNMFLDKTKQNDTNYFKKIYQNLYAYNRTILAKRLNNYSNEIYNYTGSDSLFVNSIIDSVTTTYQRLDDCFTQMQNLFVGKSQAESINNSCNDQRKVFQSQVEFLMRKRQALNKAIKKDDQKNKG